MVTMLGVWFICFMFFYICTIFLQAGSYTDLFLQSSYMVFISFVVVFLFLEVIHLHVLKIAIKLFLILVFPSVTKSYIKIPYAD
jgi:hypothetical protein